MSIPFPNYGTRRNCRKLICVPGCLGDDCLVQLPVQLAHGPGPDIAKQTFKTVILIVGPWQKTLTFRFRVVVAGADLL